jgi:hypothetical protein
MQIERSSVLSEDPMDFSDTFSLPTQLLSLIGNFFSQIRHSSQYFSLCDSNGKAPNLT